MPAEKKEPQDNSSSICKSDETMIRGANLPDFAYDGIPVSSSLLQNELQITLIHSCLYPSIPHLTLLFIFSAVRQVVPSETVFAAGD